MAWRNPDRDHSQLAAALEVFVGAKLDDVHTAMPGLIASYDASTQRAQVTPGLRLIAGGKTLDRPDLIDVPVLHPAGGGFTVHLPLQPGDRVMLVFSEAGLTEWKATRDIADPDPGPRFSMRDAVAIPGSFGVANFATRDGAAIQSDDGEVSVQLLADKIQLWAGGSRVGVVTDSGLEITGDVTISGDLTVAGETQLSDDVMSGSKSIGSGHFHVPPTVPAAPPLPPRTGPPF